MTRETSTYPDGEAWTVGVVDATSGGRYIAERLDSLGVTVVRLQSERGMTESEMALFRHGDKNRTALLPGAESGVIVAERWARDFGLRGNDPATSLIRRDKHKMAKALCDKNLPICRQALHTILASAEEWAAHIGYPVVVKPPASSGSDLVRICRNPHELSQAARNILTEKTKYNTSSEGVLVQEFMDGEEYTLDGVAFSGSFIPFSIGRYQKIQMDGSFVYDLIEFHHPASHDVDPRLVAYGKEVVKALGVDFGPVHIEIMLTCKGPLLVELAARSHGGIATGVIDASFEPRFTDAIVASYLGAAAESFDEVRLKAHSLIYFLKNETDGVVESVPGKDTVEALSSYVSSLWLIEPGDHSSKTVDLSTCPALIHLANRDRSELDADLARLRALDDGGELIRLRENTDA